MVAPVAAAGGGGSGQVGNGVITQTGAPYPSESAPAEEPHENMPPYLVVNAIVLVA